MKLSLKSGCISTVVACQANVVKHRVNGLAIVEVPHSGEELLEGNLVEGILKSGKIAVVEVILKAENKCTVRRCAYAISNDHAEKHGVCGIAGEINVHEAINGNLYGSAGALANINVNISVGGISEDANEISEVLKISLATGKRNAELAGNMLLSYDINVNGIVFLVVIELNAPATDGSIVGEERSLNTCSALLESRLESIEICYIIKDGVKKCVKASETAELLKSVNECCLAILCCVNANEIVYSEAVYKLIVNIELIVSESGEQKLKSNVYCQRLIVEGRLTLEEACVNIDGEVLIAVSNNVDVLVSYNSVCVLYVSGRNVCGNIGGILTAGKSNVAGNLTCYGSGLITVCIVVNNYYITSTDNVAVNIKSIEVKKSGGVECERIADILEKDNYCGSGHSVKLSGDVLYEAELIYHTGCTYIEVDSLEAIIKVLERGANGEGDALTLFCDQITDNAKVELLDVLVDLNGELGVVSGLITVEGELSAQIDIAHKLKCTLITGKVDVVSELSQSILDGRDRCAGLKERIDEVLHEAECNLLVKSVDVCKIYSVCYKKSTDICLVCLLGKSEIKSDLAVYKLECKVRRQGVSEEISNLNKLRRNSANSYIHRKLILKLVSVSTKAKLGFSNKCTGLAHSLIRNNLTGHCHVVNAAVRGHHLNKSIGAEATVINSIKQRLKRYLHSVLICVNHSVVIESNVIVLHELSHHSGECAHKSGRIGSIYLHYNGILAILLGKSKYNEVTANSLVKVVYKSRILLLLNVNSNSADNISAGLDDLIELIMGEGIALCRNFLSKDNVLITICTIIRCGKNYSKIVDVDNGAGSNAFNENFILVDGVVELIANAYNICNVLANHSVKYRSVEVAGVVLVAISELSHLVLNCRNDVVDIVLSEKVTLCKGRSNNGCALNLNVEGYLTVSSLNEVLREIHRLLCYGRNGSLGLKSSGKLIKVVALKIYKSVGSLEISLESLDCTAKLVDSIDSTANLFKLGLIHHTAKRLGYDNLEVFLEFADYHKIAIKRVNFLSELSAIGVVVSQTALTVAAHKIVNLKRVISEAVVGESIDSVVKLSHIRILDNVILVLVALALNCSCKNRKSELVGTDFAHLSVIYVQCLKCGDLRISLAGKDAGDVKKALNAGDIGEGETILNLYAIISSLGDDSLALAVEEVYVTVYGVRIRYPIKALIAGSVCACSKLVANDVDQAIRLGKTNVNVNAIPNGVKRAGGQNCNSLLSAVIVACEEVIYYKLIDNRIRSICLTLGTGNCGVIGNGNSGTLCVVSTIYRIVIRLRCNGMSGKI